MAFLLLGGLVGCAASGAPPSVGTRDGGPGEVDSGPRVDAGPAVDAGMPVPDAGTLPGEGGACSACESEADCLVGHYCLELPVGGKVCLPRCNTDLPDCAPRFDCIANFTAGAPEPVCAPVGERCCVDFDGDLYGAGVGCFGFDCDDTNDTIHEGAPETCDGIDQSCSGTADDGDPALLCPRGEHVSAAACESGSCTIATCEPGWDDCNGVADDGCEERLTSTTSCGACGRTCSLPHATATCASGSCAIASCDPGWADCNGRPDDGCEQATNTASHCGGCGITCTRDHATATCGSGSCALMSCNPLWGDCDFVDTNGCETSLTTNANCGACGTSCAPSRGVGDCSTGTCRVTGCSGGWGDCDEAAANGCETPLNTLSNCGTCGTTCSRPNGSTSCASGSCTLTMCNPLWGNCDGLDGNGCERQLNTTANCGMCGRTCSFPGASASCGSGTCTLGSCSLGYSNCDGNTVNGCEVRHSAVAGSCGSPATNAGSRDGDTSCGFFCSSNPEDEEPFGSFTGNTSHWFQARVVEDSTCSATIRHRLQLTVPAGVNYNLYVYRSCGTVVASSTGGTGVDEAVTIEQSDSGGSDDDFTYFVEVRYISGRSCTDWTMEFFGHDC